MKKTRPLKYVRRCHKCWSTNESNQKIEKCTCCGKHFAPYFFCPDVDEKTKKTFQYPPLRGISLSWS